VVVVAGITLTTVDPEDPAVAEAWEKAVAALAALVLQVKDLLAALGQATLVVGHLVEAAAEVALDKLDILALFLQ
jgi:hypothetical protein